MQGRQFNAKPFFAHPEYVLLTMMADSDLEVRCQAVHVIQKLKKERDGSMSISHGESDVDYASNDADLGYSEDELSEEKQDEEDIAMSKESKKDICNCRVPKLKWGATSYYTMINLKSEQTLTRNLNQ